MNHTFAIAVCSLNGETRLPATLDALYQQISNGTQVIVVDDGSTDSTSQVAASFGAQVVRHKSNMGYGKARQSAIDASNSTVLAFIDDECEVSKDWFSTLERTWSEHKPGMCVLAGPITFTPIDFLSGYLARHNPFAPIRGNNGQELRFLNRMRRSLLSEYDTSSGFILSAGNGNLSFLVEEIQEIGGYNTTLTKGGEDEDLCRRVRQRFGSGSIYFDSNLCVTHNSQESVLGIVRRNFRYGHASGIAWLTDLGIPTFLPAPTILLLLTLTFWLVFSWKWALIGLFVTPILAALISQQTILISRPFFLIDGYLRLVSEISQNLGFISATFTRK